MRKKRLKQSASGRRESGKSKTGKTMRVTSSLSPQHCQPRGHHEAKTEEPCSPLHIQLWHVRRRQQDRLPGRKGSDPHGPGEPLQKQPRDKEEKRMRRESGARPTKQRQRNETWPLVAHSMDHLFIVLLLGVIHSLQETKHRHYTPEV